MTKMLPAGTVQDVGQNYRHQQELSQAKQDLENEKAEHRKTAEELAKCLTILKGIQLITHPLYKMLREIHGEIEPVVSGVSVDSNTREVAGPSRVVAFWQEKMASMRGKSALVIDALLKHGPLVNKQLAVITGLDPRTVNSNTFELKNKGLIYKDGETWKLQEI